MRDIILTKTILFMKKSYMMLFGAMFALTASAQGQSKYFHNGWRLDSLVTVADDGYYMREVYSYDASGLLTSIYGEEFNGEVLFTSKSVMTYNEQGMTKSQDLYRLVDGEFLLLARSEVTEYSAENGMPMVILSSSAGNTPGSELLPLTKTVITKFNGLNFAEEELYTWLGGDWTKSGFSTAEYNDQGLIVKLVEGVSYMGYETTSETTYEYDAHGYVTKDVYNSALGIPSTITYTNEYDANDNLSMVTLVHDEFYTKRTHYYWSLGQGTAIQGIKAAGTDSRWYDLNGRRLPARPTQKGIFIRNGKKFVNR